MCEKACPVAIPLTTLYKKVEKDVLELFDYEAGIDRDTEPLLSVFDPNDTHSARPTLHVFVYGVARNRLQQAARRLHVPLTVDLGWGKSWAEAH